MERVRMRRAIISLAPLVLVAALFASSGALAQQDISSFLASVPGSPSAAADEATKKGGVYVNEVLANPAKGDDDFIELFNSGDEAVDLTGWRMYDSKGAERSSEANAQLAAPDAIAGATPTEDAEDEDDTFVFGADGCKNTSSIAAGATLLLKRKAPCSFTFGLGRKDSVTLENANGETVDAVTWGKADALKGVSLSRVPDGSGAFERGAPTPGATNEAAPVATLKAAMHPSADVTGECCKKLAKINFSSNLPVMVFNTKCQEVVDEPKIRTQMCTCSPSSSSSSQESGKMDYDGWAGIEIRGSSSARDHEKKGMALKLWNATGQDVEFPLLGLPKVRAPLTHTHERTHPSARLPSDSMPSLPHTPPRPSQP